jgi:hypothetical protein
LGKSVFLWVELLFQGFISTGGLKLYLVTVVLYSRSLDKRSAVQGSNPVPFLFNGSFIHLKFDEPVSAFM